MSEELNYEEKYKESAALNESLKTQLNKSLDEINKLKADLQVAQMVNQKTVGTSTDIPKTDNIHKVSLSERLAEFRNKKEVKE